MDDQTLDGFLDITKSVVPRYYKHFSRPHCRVQDALEAELKAKVKQFIKLKYIFLLHFISFLNRKSASTYQEAIKKADKEVAKKFLVKKHEIQDDAILREDAEVGNIAIIYLPV